MSENMFAVRVLRKLIPERFWEAFWIFLPIFPVIALIVGGSLLAILARLGFQDAPRLTQLLIISSIAMGPVTGIFTLLFVRKADVSQKVVDLALWLGRFGVVTPLLLVLILFLIFERP